MHKMTDLLFFTTICSCTFLDQSNLYVIWAEPLSGQAIFVTHPSAQGGVAKPFDFFVKRVPMYLLPIHSYIDL